MKESFEFTDINSEGNGDSRTRLTDNLPRTGCHVTAVMGFMLTLVAILIAVGVGLIVHFASPAKNIECHCNFPEGAGSNQPPSAEAQWQACTELAKEKDHCLVAGCPGGSPAPNITTTTVAIETTSIEPEHDVNIRLPRALSPINYNVELEPKMYEGPEESFTFRGTVKILFECTETTSNITLHSRNLTFENSSIALSAFDGSPAPVITSYDLERSTDFLILKLGSTLAAGKNYQLMMGFSGPLKKDLKGLYLSSYEINNSTEYLATSQLETTDARKVFPCFDEPGFKATFDITLVRHTDYSAISNMPRIQSNNLGGNRVADVFNTTEKMSTYLLAFVVSKFANKSAMTPRGVEVRVWAPPHKLHQADYALQFGVDTLEYFEKLYEVNYPLRKLDMVTVPDFSAGGMENWGLIIYKETLLLYDPDISSSKAKMSVARVVAHEIGHQWFGDLVTPEWWDDIWLNEGFATFVARLGMNNSHPEWNTHQTAVVEEIHKALAADGIKGSHPVFVPVNSKADMGRIFDTISYEKGASIISMLKYYLGEETFQLGIQNYLRANQFGSTNHDELWDALDKAAEDGTDHVTVKEIMDTWILQMNYPVVKVTRSRDNAFRISQSRFLVDTDAEEDPKYPSMYNYKWEIPFSYTTSLEKDFDTTRTKLMRRNTGLEEIEDVNIIPSWDETSWVIGNVKERGFYRVNYDSENWKSLIKQLKNNHKVFAVENRAQLINDAWSLAKAGLADPKIALNMIDYLEYEEEYIPWKSADNELRYVNKMLHNSDIYGQFKKYLSNLLRKPYQRVGWKTDGVSDLESSYQSLILGYACRFGVSDCAREPTRLFAEWMKDQNNNPIPVDLRPVTYCTAIAEGGVEEWDFAYMMYKKASEETQRKTIQAALACSKETWILNRYLRRCLDPNEIGDRDVSSVIKSVAGSTIGQYVAWDFVRENWDKLKERYSSIRAVFDGVIRPIISDFNTEFDLQQVKDFIAIKDSELSSVDGSVKSALKSIETNIKWRKKMEPVITEWLNEQGEEEPGEDIDVRLPTSLIPLEYHIELKPDFYHEDPSNFTFSGNITIRMRCDKPTTNITFHSDTNLNIDNDSIMVWEGSSIATSGTPITFQSPTVDELRQFFILPLDTELTPGNEYYISLRFTSPLVGSGNGLYYSSYKQGNRTVYLASTQFESITARKAFPCFDEPALKAEFNIILVRKPGYISLSNMPVNKTENRSDGFMADIFEKTVKMSTYTLAFYVCDFEHKEQNTTSGAKLRVYARRDVIETAEFALTTGVKVLEKFENYYNISYPLPKLDMIAGPVSTTAMENWGLVIYKESLMLYEPLTSFEDDKETVAHVVSHELAHMWFGNLVTMDWWSDTWLNEGFARFVQHLGVETVQPDWQTYDYFVRVTVGKAMEIDGKVTSPHPMSSPVALRPGRKFSGISYNKGAAVLNMIKHALGDITFKEGIKNYLRDFAYSNTVPDDLYTALSKQSAADGSNIDVKSVMDTWALQINYPLVTFTRSGPNSVVITQRRYLQDPTAVDPGKYPSPYDFKWEIPVTFTSNLDNNLRVYWLHQTKTNMTITDSSLIPDDSDPSSWLLGNVNQAGFYRVNYDADNWDSLAKQLLKDHTVIKSSERTMLFNNAWNLQDSGHTDLISFLRLTEYLSKEKDYSPLKVATDEIQFVNSMIHRSGRYGDFKAYMRKMISQLYQKMRWDNTNATHLEIHKRTLAIKIACNYEYPDCVREAQKLFSKWMRNTNNNPIHLELQSSVYETAIREGGEAEWDFLYGIYKEIITRIDPEETNLEVTRILKALGASKQPWILTRFLERVIQPAETQNITSNENSVFQEQAEMRTRDYNTVMSSVIRNNYGQGLAWDFVRANFDNIRRVKRKRYPTETAESLLEKFSGVLNTDFQLQQAEEFLIKHGVSTEDIDSSLKPIRYNIKWAAKNEDVIADWLNTQGDEKPEVESVNMRLPLALIPEEYHVELKPDLYGIDSANFTFSGSVKIRMRCDNATENVTLHNNGLAIETDTILVWSGSSEAATGTPIPILAPILDTERQFLIVPLDAEMTPGNEYYISMHFSAPLNASSTGFYLRSYKQGNDTVYLATTQLESTSARRVFPCFDEPALKAEFNIILLRKPEYISLSNMPVNRTEIRSDGFVADVFEKTVKMSTYTLAFVVGDFAYKEKTTVNGVQFRVYSKPSSINQTDYALSIGVKILEYFEKYFNITYPLPKLDMIAIPDRPGAMENWGLIIYGESFLLYEKGISTSSTKNLIASIISHEIAHMWFGNLVTMDWWSDTWLNEGFASFCEHLGVSHVHPDWNQYGSFIAAGNGILGTDSSFITRPLHNPANTPEEISAMFSRITYNKGAAVINMMRQFLGESTFREGLQNYLQAYSYKSTTKEDLFQFLSQRSSEDGSNIDVKSVMDTWVLQSNYPLVTLNRTGPNSVVITQERYLENPDAVDPGKYPSPYGYKWEIPVTLTSNLENVSSENRVFWFLKNETSITIHDPSLIPDNNNNNASWLLGNVKHAGYYRVNYDADSWEALIRQLKEVPTVIDPIDRTQLFDNAWNLVKSGHLEISLPLRLTEYLHDEDDYFTLSEAYGELDYVNRMLQRSRNYGAFQDYMTNLIDPLYQRMSWNFTNSTYLEIQKRSLAIRVACTYEHTGCVEEAKRQFSEWTKNKDNNAINRAVREIVYCTAVRDGGAAEWEFMYGMFRENTLQDDEQRHQLNALACSKQPWIISRFLEMTLEPEGIDKLQFPMVIQFVAQNIVGQSMLWDFLRTNWEYLTTDYTGGSVSASRMFSTFATYSSFNTDVELQQAENLLEKYGYTSDDFQQSLDFIRKNVRWLKKHNDAIADWLTS